MFQHKIERGETLSVVVPCYNEQDNLDELIRRLEPICCKEFGDTWEIVLVNDGSRDATWAVIAMLVEQNPHVVGVNLARNYGHQLALSAGLSMSTGDLILVLDADLQDPPELLPMMLERYRAGHDVVYGQRTRRIGETAFKRATAAAFYRLLERLVDIKIPRDTGDFRLMTRRVLDALNAMPERYRFVRGMVSWIGYRQCAVPYDRDPRFSGASNYPLAKMVGFAIDAVTSFSIVPLRYASHLGALFGLAGLAAIAWVAISWLQGGTVAGWASLTVLVLVLGSVQLLVLGVFGEYLGRMYMETKRRPLYLIDEVRGKHRENDTASDAFKVPTQR